MAFVAFLPPKVIPRLETEGRSGQEGGQDECDPGSMG